ncbi:hypothetical protein GGI35DRAFT_249446 [Trichoderma velutinum]
MAEAIGIVSGLLALGRFASQSSIALCETIHSYQSHPHRARELAEEAGALSEVLSSLVETVEATTDIDLSLLEVPLRQCDKACQTIEQQIKKVSSRPTGTQTSLEDWAKLRCMEEDVDGFRQLLASYKITITIALIDANLCISATTAESIKGYNDLLYNAREELEGRLEGINKRLDTLLRKSGPESTPNTSELMQIQEEQLSAEKSLAICDRLSMHIAELQVEHARHPAAGTAGSSDEASVSKKITHEGLQECQHSLTRMTAKLEEHERMLFNQLTEKMKLSSSNPEKAADIARLREEWESTFESVNILSKAGSYFEIESNEPA